MIIHDSIQLLHYLLNYLQNFKFNCKPILNFHELDLFEIQLCEYEFHFHYLFEIIMRIKIIINFANLNYHYLLFINLFILFIIAIHFNHQLI